MPSRFVWLVACIVACAGQSESPLADTAADSLVATGVPEPTPVPVGLHGTWVRHEPGRRASDTLILRADSTARGWLQVGGRPSRFAITQWEVKFLSKGPVGSRSDRPLGLQDGGDADCTFAPSDACRSGPVLCLRGEGEEESHCLIFAYRPDSLAIHTGAWYTRARLSSPDAAEAARAAVAPTDTHRLVDATT